MVETTAAAAAAAEGPAPAAAALRSYCPAKDHAAVVEVCKNVYGGTDDLPEKIASHAARPDTHILVASATGSAEAELDALLCCQQRGDVLWLFGARTREEKRGNGLAQLLLEEAEALAFSLPGVVALLSVTVPANDTMRRLFARRGLRQQCQIITWPATPVAQEIHQQLAEEAQQAQQAQQAGQRPRHAPHTLLSILPAVAAVVDNHAARQLLPCWRPCQSREQLEALLLLLRQHRTSSLAAGAGATAVAAAAGRAAVMSTAAGGGQAVAGESGQQAADAGQPLGSASNAFLWLPAEYELVPAGSDRVDQLIRQGRVWLLQPARGDESAAGHGGVQQQRQQQQEEQQQGKQHQQQEQGKQHEQHWQGQAGHQAAELAAAVLVSYGAGFKGMYHAGLVAGSQAAVESALLHAALADPQCCRFYVDCCDRFQHEALWSSTGGERFDILPYYKPLASGRAGGPVAPAAAV